MLTQGRMYNGDRNHQAEFKSVLSTNRPSSSCLVYMSIYYVVLQRRFSYFQTVHEVRCITYKYYYVIKIYGSNDIFYLHNVAAKKYF